MKTWLAHLYPGTPFQYKLDNNLEFLLGRRGAYPWFHILSAYAGLWIFAPLGLRALPREIRTMAWSLVVAFPAMLVFGNLIEPRMYAEYGLFILPASVLGLARVLGRERPPR